MCGIFGRLEAEPSIDTERALRATRALAHRGPDGTGFAYGGPLGAADGPAELTSQFVPNGAGAIAEPRCATFLGFQRLSIIDLDPSAGQPMTNEDRSVWVLFNGEIYNHRELRRELVERGHRFVTDHSDTECLVHGFEEWGLDLLGELVGMFALAVLNLKSGKLLLARDRFGKKPLYYELREGRSLTFGSELKAFHAGGYLERAIDHDSVNDYLSFGYVPAPASIYRGVRKLRAGELALFDVHRFEERTTGPYWTPPVPEQAPAPTSDPKTWLEGFHALCAKSVSERLGSDVPLGVFLSGGIDSGSVAGLASATAPRLSAFTIGFDEERFDESARAATLAEAYGLEPRQRTLRSDDLLALVPELSEIYDEPFADSSALPTLALSRLARESVTVALSGDGGDELLGGYDRYALNERLGGVLDRLPSPFVDLVASGLRRAWPRRVRGAGLVRLLRPSPSERYRRFMSDETLVELAGRHRRRDPVADLWVERGSPLRSMMEVDVQLYLPEDLMVKVDRASMACSLEVRCPLLDHRLFDYVWSSTVSLWRHPDRAKAPLAAFLERTLPASFVRAPKKGFSVPLGAWFRSSPLREQSRQLLLDSGAFVHDIVPKPSIERLLNEHASGSRDQSPAIWRLWMLESWHARYGGHR